MTDEQLLEAAHQARRTAYAPYSGFLVGAAVLAEDGRVYSGCNMENVAYPEGVCAEGVALGAMVLGGARRARMIAIVAGPEGELRPTMPCGGCRQKIAEFAGPETEVVITGSDGEIQRYRMADLLPSAFTSNDLSKD